MSNRAMELLYTVQRVPGVRRCGLCMCLSRRQTVCDAGDDKPSVHAKLWQMLGDIQAVLKIHRLPVKRLRWRYGDGDVICFFRPDKVMLGALTESSFTDQAIEHLEKRLNDATL